MTRPQGLLSPKHFREDLTDEEIHEVMNEAQPTNYFQMGVEELQRRYLHAVKGEVASLHASSLRIESLTKGLIVLTIAIVLLTIGLGFFAWVQMKDMAELRALFHPVIVPAPGK